MCAISGYFFLKESTQVIEMKELLKLATEKMKSRGPDSTNYFFNQSQNLGFGHNRLSIQDLTENGSQPFFSEDKNLVLVFNGQIYNHKELRLELEFLGYKFKSTCDTEVLLFAYQAWGKASLQKLTGMFAFSIFDQDKQKLLLVRDRFGIKPLYFGLTKDSVIFASQLDALLILKKESAPLMSNLSRYHYLHLMAVPAPLTIYHGFYKLPAGYLIEASISGNDIIYEKWYDFLSRINKPSLNVPETFEKAKLKLSKLLHQSIKEHVMASDVPVAVFLSGGVDSSLIAKIASKYSRVRAIHLSIFGENNSESVFARSLAEKLNIEFLEIIISKEEFLSALDEVVLLADDLVADPVCIPFLLLSKFAKEKGFKVVLIGEGADELFWGYDLYQQHACLDYFKNFIIGFAANKIIGFFKKYLSSYRVQALENLCLNRFGSFVSGATALFSEQLLGLKNEILNNPSAFLEQEAMIAKFFPNSKNREILSFLSWRSDSKKNILNDSSFWTTPQELFHRLPELLLMRCDKVAMIYSVEARVPFLDHRIVEFALSLPLNIKIWGGHSKALLKSIAEDELGTIDVWNKKTGFAAPLLSARNKEENDLSDLQSWCLYLANKKN